MSTGVLEETLRYGSMAGSDTKVTEGLHIQQEPCTTFSSLILGAYVYLQQFFSEIHALGLSAYSA
jgi:hypothetical protein